MEEDGKNAAAANMISTSVTDHQKEPSQSPLDSSLLNQLHINEEPSQTETETETSSKKRKRVAMNNSSAFPLPLPLDSSPNITPKKRKEEPSLTTSSQTPTKRRRGRPPGSRSKKKKEEPSQTTSAETPTKRRRGRPPGFRSKKKKEEPSQTTSAETPTKRRRGRPPGYRSKKRKEGPSETNSGISGEKSTSHIIKLNAGEDVVDALYNFSVASSPKTVNILTASGSVSYIFDLTPNGPKHSKGKFELYFMVLKCVVDGDGRHCREKATFTVGYKNDKGKLFVNAWVNSLIAAGPVEITARVSAFAAAAAAAGNDEKNTIAATSHQVIAENLDPAREYGTKVMKEEGCTSVGDGNIINATSATTSTSNDQDMKSHFGV